MDHQYWVYIVASRSGTLYIGMTNNLYRRARQHKAWRTGRFLEHLWLRPAGVLREFQRRARCDWPRETTERVASGKENLVDRAPQSQVG